MNKNKGEVLYLFESSKQELGRQDSNLNSLFNSKKKKRNRELKRITSSRIIHLVLGFSYLFFSLDFVWTFLDLNLPPLLIVNLGSKNSKFEFVETQISAKKSWRRIKLSQKFEWLDETFSGGPELFWLLKNDKRSTWLMKWVNSL